MRKTLFVSITVMAISLFMANKYVLAGGSGNVITFDPISSYEVNPQEGNITIPIGATMSQDSDPVIYVDGLPSPAQFVYTTTSNNVLTKRVAGYIDGISFANPGIYNLQITVYDRASGAQSAGALKVIVQRSSLPVNAPIIFGPMQNHIILKSGDYENIAIMVNDFDPEPLTLVASGLPGQNAGIARFVTTNNSAGQRGGYLELQLYKAGTYIINLNARDRRNIGGNTAIAQLHIDVI